MKLVTIVSVLILATLIFNASTVHAQQCQVVYGGGEICLSSFSITKLTQKPGSEEFVESLSINDPTYASNSPVAFKISIKNTGFEKLTNIEVVDTLPQFLAFIAGPGNFDQNSKTLTLVIPAIEKNETAEFIVSAQTAEEQALPTDQQVFCVANQVRATHNSKSLSDSSSFCIQKRATSVSSDVLGASDAKTTPAAGANLISLIALLPLGLAGLILVRKT